MIPTSLIILTTHMWGKFLVEKIFRAKISVLVPLVPTSIGMQNKGPGAEAHFSNPPLRRASVPPPPPPPPPWSNFQVALSAVGSTC